MCKVHIALQDLKMVMLILHGMTFPLSGRVVALHLETSTTKSYLWKQSGTVSFFSF